jgi:hypothetical protein
MQLGSRFINTCNNALHVSDAICAHLQEHLKTVDMDANSVRNMYSVIAVINKHTAKLHHVGSLYI